MQVTQFQAHKIRCNNSCMLCTIQISSSQLKTNPRRISDGMFECKTLHKTWSIYLVFTNKENDEFEINSKKWYKRVNGLLKLYPFWIPRIIRKTNSWGRKHLSCIDRMFWNYIIRLPCRKVRKSYVILTLFVLGIDHEFII